MALFIKSPHHPVPWDQPHKPRTHEHSHMADNNKMPTVQRTDAIEVDPEIGEGSSDYESAMETWVLQREMCENDQLIGGVVIVRRQA